MNNIHSGNLSYLTRLHQKKYGKLKYWMKHLRTWPDGKWTVEFIPYETEKSE